MGQWVIQGILKQVLLLTRPQFCVGALKLGWIGCAIQQVTPKRHPQFFSNFQDMFFFNHFVKNPQSTIALTFLTNIISDIGGVRRASAALLPTYLCTRDINIIIRVTLIIMQKFSAV